MKNTFATVGFALVLIMSAACGSKQKEGTQETSPTEEKKAEVTKSKGLLLMEASDCATCHKSYEKLVGPSYTEINAKYGDADVDMLSQKVISGGSGIFGEAQMTPHPTVTPDEAKEMVKYILTVN